MTDYWMTDLPWSKRVGSLWPFQKGPIVNVD